MSPIMEEILSDSNSILTSDEPLSPTLQPQRRLKSRPTTQISFDAYSSSSSGSSIKSFNTTPNKVDTGADYLLGLISKSNSNSATSSERTKISPFHNVKIGKRPHSKIMLTKEASSEEEELAQQNICIDSDVPLDNNGDDSIISRNDISVTLDDKEYSGYRRKYGHEDPQSITWSRHRKHFFILSSAGKPIYTRYGDESRISSYMGVIQAIVSFFADADDTIRCINAGQHKLVFLLKGPLYLVAVSRTNESEMQLRDQLSYLYNQIVSVLTTTQLTKIFEQRVNFDLRRLLGGTEPFLDNLASTMSDEPGFMFSSIQCVRMSKDLRDKVGSIMQSIKPKDLLYAMLITNNKLLTLLRPRKHSLHPADLHLVFNMVNGSSTFRSVESWTPICLPKFNNKGFLHAYVCYIASNVCLLFISPDKDKFFECSEAKNLLKEELSACNALQEIEKASQNEGYSIADIGVPGLRHFIYKSRTHVQYTSPAFVAPYGDPREKQKLYKLYCYTHDRMHSRLRPLKVHYYVSSTETILGWITCSFELYAVFGPLISKSALTSSSHTLLRWIKKEEESLFIVSSPVF
ncbi:trafficking protein Mon1-domain-containing protein [Gigaspora rosea]|uniref:Vacuolar fusion protein MON1 n=1 Tax=Gigaspora rosea TaxID=44941 RepID=A0A397VW58_9GLOM|nr:trafficking protein Mon1-domain-containing protein [Gigaspora rosea]